MSIKISVPKSIKTDAEFISELNDVIFKYRGKLKDNEIIECLKIVKSTTEFMFTTGGKS